MDAAGGPCVDTARRKRSLRGDVLAARRQRTPQQVADDSARITAAALGWPALRQARTVAAYLALPGEPDLGPMLDVLHTEGRTVLLPVLLADGDLGWAVYEGEDRRLPGRAGTRAPAGPMLAPSALADAGLVFVPGLAVDAAGMRLGRGGGSYDRALARLGHSNLTVVVLFSDEVVPEVPAEAHDRPVDAVLTPDGIRFFAA